MSVPQALLSLAPQWGLISTGKEQLVGLILLFEKVNSRYKGFIPLKKVYVPRPEEIEE